MVDPWGGYVQGMQGLGQTLTDLTMLDRQRKQDILNNRKEEMALSDTEAQQGALQDTYGAGSLREAYAKKMQADREQAQLNSFMSHIDNMKKAGATSQFITEWAKSTLAKDPRYAPMVDSINFIDNQKIKLVRTVKDGELPDPTKPGEFMPAGTYELEGRATGDAKQPYVFDTMIPYVSKAETETWSAPFEMSVGGKRAMVQRSNRGQIRPVIQDVSTTVVVRNGEGSGKPPSGYRWKADGSLEAIPGGPGAKGTATKVLPAGQVESLVDFKNLAENLVEASDILKNKKVSTGPIAGRGQSAAAKVGMGNDDFVNVQQRLSTAHNIMLKLRSGAAVTEQEYSRFLKEYPTVNDPPDVFTRKAKNVVKYAKDLVNTKLSGFEESGYRVPKETATITPIPQRIQTRVSKALREGQPFTFTYEGVTYTGTRKNGKLAFE